MENLRAGSVVAAVYNSQGAKPRLSAKDCALEFKQPPKKQAPLTAEQARANFDAFKVMMRGDKKPIQ